MLNGESDWLVAASVYYSVLVIYPRFILLWEKNRIRRN